MKVKSKKAGILLFIFVVLSIGTAGVLINRYFFSKTAVVEREKAKLPTPAESVTQAQVESSKLKVESKTATPISEKLNLDVPFTSQAPHANWDFTHEEACEEAAILMAGRYFRGQKIAGPDDAEKGLQEIISWEKENLGFFESTTAGETERVIRSIYGLKTEIVENPTVDQIKTALAEGRLVLGPSAGRQIGNPFYKSPGPLYHMLLIKGYTETQFITNDAGTKRGANYPYKFETVLKANHDWNGGDVGNGAKRVIFVW
jgi:hypothetical protein